MSPAGRWDVPPHPRQGNKRPDPIYRAVGVALSRWEELEFTLAKLLGVFLGITPLQATRHISYSDAPRFVDRLTVIDNAASAFFRKHCDQSFEGDCGKLNQDSTSAFWRRNDIAHGIVTEIWHRTSPYTTEYCLLPPNHRQSRFESNGSPVYAYNSKIILQFAAGFLDLGNDARRLHSRLASRHGAPLL
jgi:hypothetical protein